MAPSREKCVTRFVITETARHKRGFTIYKVTSLVTLKTSKEIVSKLSIWKRYSDFKKLHLALRTLHTWLQIKEPYPQFPKPKFFGRFSKDVIEERRECAVKFLEFIARHTLLFKSDIFVKFFEHSLADDYLNDCSQSISSDTSEDDWHSSLDHAEAAIDRSLEKSVPKTIIDVPVPEDYICNEPQMEPTVLNECHVKLNENGSSASSNMIESNSLSNITTNSKNGVYLHDGSDLPKTEEDTAQYILIAAAHMSAAFRHEAIAEYEEAFTQYKLGISNLLNGIQNDSDVSRIAIVKEKISKYLERAERLYNRHLNCNVSLLDKPVLELQNYKVVKVMGTVMLVKDKRFDCMRIIKTVEKPMGNKEDISNYILRGKVPYMVQLHACVQTDTTVFLILQYVSGIKLWDYIKHNYKPCNDLSVVRKGHTRSSSCNAVIQNESLHVDAIKTSNLSRESLNSDESLKKLEEEFGANSIYSKSDLPTMQLLEKSQRLLQSVNATLKKSNSIASRLNESEKLLYSWKTASSINLQTSSKPSKESQTADLSFNKQLADKEILEVKHDENVEEHSSAYLNCHTQSALHVSSDIVNVTLNGRVSSVDDLHVKTVSSQTLFNDPVVQLKINDDVEVEEEELWNIPEDTVRLWAAQILLTLEALHQQDVIVLDLRPEKVLVDETGENLILTYIVPRREADLSRPEEPYSAPELCMFLPTVPPTPAADVWSFGVLLYEFFAGNYFQRRHSGPFHSHSSINIPKGLSDNAKSLLPSILKYEPSERLTIPEIKQHSFFEGIDCISDKEKRSPANFTYTRCSIYSDTSSSKRDYYTCKMDRNTDELTDSQSNHISELDDYSNKKLIQTVVQLSRISN